METCTWCGQEIDPDVCWCGEMRESHNDYNLGHTLVPLGCECLRHKKEDN